MKVDIHAHFYPRGYLQELESLCGDTPADQAWQQIVRGKIASTPTMWSIDDRLAEMDALGIDVQVLSLSIPNVYFDDAAKSLYLAQLVNEAFAEVCRKHPNRFIAFASVPLNNIDVALDELGRAIDRLGLCGLALGANVRGKPLSSVEFLPLYSEVNRRSLPLFIHPMIPVGIEALREFDLAANTGYLFDTTVAVASMVFRGIFEENRDIKLIIPHLGAVLPFTVARLDASFRTRSECRRNISFPPSEYLKRFYYDTVNLHRPALKCAIETFGADRLVFGSDYPFALASVSECLAAVRGLQLSPEEESMILGQRALEILRQPSVP